MKQTIIILCHAFVGWVLCAATIGIAFNITSAFNALVIHAIGAPVFFGIISWNYFRKFHFTTPLTTALIFLGFVFFMDFTLISMIILKNFDMFHNPLGTWIPFTLIFTSTLVVGKRMGKLSKNRNITPPPTP